MHDVLSRKKNINWLIKESKAKFGGQYDYSLSVYVDAKTKIAFTCKKHNYTFHQKSNDHLKSSYPCQFCLKENKQTPNEDALELFQSKMIEKFGDVFSFEKAAYTNDHSLREGRLLSTILAKR